LGEVQSNSRCVGQRRHRIPGCGLTQLPRRRMVSHRRPSGHRRRWQTVHRRPYQGHAQGIRVPGRAGWGRVRAWGHAGVDELAVVGELVDVAALHTLGLRSTRLIQTTRRPPCRRRATAHGWEARCVARNCGRGPRLRRNLRQGC